MPLLGFGVTFLGYAVFYYGLTQVRGGNWGLLDLIVPGKFDPSVAMDSAGDFVVAWQSYGEGGSSYGVYAQRYTAAGAALDCDMHVADYLPHLNFRTAEFHVQN